MRSIVLGALLCASAFGASAAIPISFAPSYSTSAAVTGGAEADAQFANYPGNDLPLITSATVAGSDYFSSGSGIAAAGLLSTQAEADSNGVATAVGAAEFTGSFVGQLDVLQLSFSFDATNAVDPSAFGATTLVVSLMQDGNVLSSELFSDSGTFTRSFATMVGGNYALDFSLSSEADDLTGGNAFSAGTLTFEAAAVPEPSSFALMLVGLVGVGLGKARARAQRAPA
jgi:PEP-CTERM motif